MFFYYVLFPVFSCPEKGVYVQNLGVKNVFCQNFHYLELRVKGLLYKILFVGGEEPVQVQMAEYADCVHTGCVTCGSNPVQESDPL